MSFAANPDGSIQVVKYGYLQDAQVSERDCLLLCDRSMLSRFVYRHFQISDRALFQIPSARSIIGSPSSRPTMHGRATGIPQDAGNNTNDTPDETGFYAFAPGNPTVYPGEPLHFEVRLVSCGGECGPRERADRTEYCIVCVCVPE